MQMAINCKLLFITFIFGVIFAGDSQFYLHYCMAARTLKSDAPGIGNGKGWVGHPGPRRDGSKSDASAPPIPKKGASARRINYCRSSSGRYYPCTTTTRPQKCTLYTRDCV